MRMCEPCGYHGDETPATGSRGMDTAPVCEWHQHKSWAYSATRLAEIFYSPTTTLTKSRVEELIKIGTEAIKVVEREHNRIIREDDYDPYVGAPVTWSYCSNRGEVAARIIIEALIARDVIR